jgi:TRAP-type C4-dicarboxylate transport system permease small subunit
VNEAGHEPGGLPRGFGRAGRALLTAARGLALAGGLVFLVLVGMSVVSIVGRKLASSPVQGDVEMLQMSAAFACAAFFGYCHLIGGDVKVDFFTSRLSPRAIHRLDAFGSLLYTIVGAALTWRTFAGSMVLRASHETSVILGWPLWVAQLMMVPGFLLMTAAGLYMMGLHWRRANEAPQGARAAA